ncbi:dodecin family protein [Streptomyces kaempferi]
MEGRRRAICKGVRRASQALRNLDRFDVTHVCGQITEGAIAHWQVGPKVGLRVEETMGERT